MTGQMASDNRKEHEKQRSENTNEGFLTTKRRKHKKKEAIPHSLLTGTHINKHTHSE